MFNLKIALKSKAIILPWLTFQNSIHTLLLRYVRIRKVEQMFYASVAVFMMELCKFSFCFFALVFLEGNGFWNTLRMVEKEIIKNKRDTLKVVLPTLLYTLQNNIVYVGASHLDSASFIVIYQMRILFAAIFSAFILKRHQTLIQWISIFTLFMGVSIVSFQMDQNKHKRNSNHDNQDHMRGVIAVMMAAMISGLAGVLLEKVYKNKGPVSIWIRNLQMSIASIPSSYAMIQIKNGDDIAENGYFYGFDGVIWFLVLWLSIGGLTIAFCLKYADNISKDFATANSILIVTVISFFIFDFRPNHKYLMGLFIVVVSTFFYSESFAEFIFNYNRSQLIHL